MAGQKDGRFKRSAVDETYRGLTRGRAPLNSYGRRHVEGSDIWRTPHTSCGRRRGLMNRAAVVLVCVGATTSTSASAHICWIDHVKAERSGVRVFFGSSAYGHGGRAPGEALYIDDSGIHLGAATKPVRGLFLAPGEGAGVHAGPEDTCGITVSEQDGKLGVTVTAEFALPG